MRFTIISLILICTTICNGQGLFESASESVLSDDNTSPSYELGGYVRAGYFAGEALQHNNEWATQSAYSEAALNSL